MFVLLSLILVFFSYILINYYKALCYWKNKGIKYVKPLPIFGNSLPTVLQARTLPEFVIDLYNKFSDERYCGTFQYRQPILLVRDTDLIKRIFIREFDTFPEHPVSFNPKGDPLWGKNLFASSGEKWKHLRQIISSFFTPSKMKSMFVLMEDCAKQLMDYLHEQDEDVIEVELRDIFKKYSADVIASVGFGIKCNSFEEPDNEFIRMGVQLTNFSGIQRLKRLLYTVNPAITKILNLKMHPEKVQNFFRRLVKTSIESREKKHIIRSDFIQHLLDARRGHLQQEESRESLESEFTIPKEANLGSRNKHLPLQLTDDDITAQALDFFYGGFYSTSSLIYFCLYELVINPKIQDKLRKEVDETLVENNGTISYDALIKMKYLDMVISETLRKWPTPWIDRKSLKSITIEPERITEKPLYLESGTICWIPVFAIHRDPKHWPNPERFDPERFNEQNRSKIHSFSFLPFGSGPRNCTGSKFAIMEAKLVISYVLSSYEVVPTESSVITKNPFLTSASSFWFGFKRRVTEYKN